MWRACLDLQQMMDDLLIKRAEIVGKRKKLAKKAERMSKNRRRGMKSTGTRRKRRTTSES
jgi:hypothetical protein